MRILLVLLVCLAAIPATAQTSAEVLFAKARGLNPTLRDYSADIDLKVDANLGFIVYQPKMNGKYYYKRPDKHKLDISNAPDYIKKYGNVFGFHLPQLERYHAKVVGTAQIKGRRLQKVELTPKVKSSDIERLELYIDPQRGTVPKYDTFYTKGHLYVDIDFTQKQSYWVFDKMTAEFALPNITARASATYANYQFNQNLQDSFFSLLPTGIRYSMK